MMRFADIAILFHGLTGLCAGWLLGSRQSVPLAFVLAALGCATGIAAGFLIGRLPKAVRLVGARIPRKYRVLATLFAMCGLGVGVAFWTACLHCAGF